MGTGPVVETTQSEAEAWFSTKTFTSDWTSHVLDTWSDLFAGLRDQRVDVLEIGSWEGRSAVFFLHFLRQCQITCIDTFGGGAEHVGDASWAAELPYVRDRFTANTAEFGDRVRLLPTSSARALTQLRDEGAAYDLAYVDGSHDSADVLADATGCWALLRPGGWLVFDDYEWHGFDDPARTPKPGVDAFLDAHAGEYVERHRGWQLVVQRVAVSGVSSAWTSSSSTSAP